MATASDDETARIWDIATGKQVRVFPGQPAGLNAVDFDSTGKRIVTAGEDETARLWDVATGKQLRAWGKHEGAVRAAGFEADDKRLWTKTVQGVRRVWNIEDGSLVSEDLAAGKDSDRFGVLYLKRRKDDYEIWSGPVGVPGEGRKEGEPLLRPRVTMRGDSQFSAGAITADGKTVASSGKSRTVSLWDIERGTR